MAKKKKRAQLPDGLVVYENDQKTINLVIGIVGGSVLALFFLIGGIVLLVEGSIGNGMVCLGSFLLIVAAVIFLCIQFARTGRVRLVIGRTGLSLFDHHGEQLGNLPYENLAFARIHQVERQQDWETIGVAIGVTKMKNEDTWWPGLMRGEDYDILLKSFAMDPLALHRQIELQHQRYYENKKRLSGRY